MTVADPEYMNSVFSASLMNIYSKAIFQLMMQAYNLLLLLKMDLVGKPNPSRKTHQNQPNSATIILSLGEILAIMIGK